MTALLLADAASVDPVQYGIAGVVAFVLGGFITKLVLLYRTDLIDRATKAEQQRDSLTQTFHDFVQADRSSALEAVKINNQITEDLLAKDEAKDRRISELERDIEWERRGRGQGGRD